MLKYQAAKERRSITRTLMINWTETSDGKCKDEAADLFSGMQRSKVGYQPKMSLIWFHIARTSVSVLPILVEITRQENRDFSSDFKVYNFCLSSIVHVLKGLGEREGDLSDRRRRLAGALGVAFAFCLRLAGVAAVDESLDGSGRSSGDGAARC